MATNIDINDVTNATIVEDGTGIFDRLIGAAFLHIEKQVDEQRLTQSTAGEVYSSAIQSAMAQAIQFVLQKKQTEAQVDMVLAQTSELLLNGVKDRELKDAELAQLEKQTENLENQDLLTLAQIGKTKIEADVSAALGTKEVDLKVQQIAQVSTEIKILEQKVVGRKQSNMVGE